jgi:hypothetical protein
MTQTLDPLVSLSNMETLVKTWLGDLLPHDAVELCNEKVEIQGEDIDEMLTKRRFRCSYKKVIHKV